MTYVLPFRYYLVVLRCSAAWGYRSWPQGMVVIISGVATMILAIRRFHKTL